MSLPLRYRLPPRNTRPDEDNACTPAAWHNNLYRWSSIATPLSFLLGQVSFRCKPAPYRSIIFTETTPRHIHSHTEDYGFLGSDIYQITRRHTAENHGTQKTGCENDVKLQHCRHFRPKNVRYSYSRNKPWRPIGLWDVKDPTLSRQSAYRWW
jgi:hypothetical protein